MMETMQAMTHWGKLKTVLEGYVGFDTVQEQIRKKSLKRGFEFNLMVVGKLLLLFEWHHMLKASQWINPLSWAELLKAWLALTIG